MRTTTIRAAAGAVAVAVAAALAVALPTPVAQAATVYTWTQGYAADGSAISGADHTSWADPKNWSPQAVPGTGASVVLDGVPGYGGGLRNATLTVPAGMSLASLTMRQTGQTSVYLTGGPLRVTGDFDWTGGWIQTSITVAGTGRVGPGTGKYLSTSDGTRFGMLDVTGTLLLDNIGTGETARLTLYPDNDTHADGVRVAKGAILRATGTNMIMGTGCCTDPAKVVVNGTIDVTGTTTVSAVELSLRGTTKVARGAVLASTASATRLGANAAYTGGGTVDFTASASIRAYPNKEPVPGGTLMEGIGKLGDRTRIHLGPGALLTGVGGFAGNGTVEVSSPRNSGDQSATIYGDLTIGATTKLRLAGAIPSRTDVFNDTLRGYHPVLRIKGVATVVRGSTFITQQGTVTTIRSGGRLQLEPRSVWGEGSCCVAAARLNVAKGGTLAVKSGGGAPAKITRTDLRLKGSLSLAAGKRLVTQGYPATIGGTLKVGGRAGATVAKTVVTGSKIKGRFTCVSPGNQVARYSTTAVRLTGTLGSFSGCQTSLNKKVMAKALGKKQKVAVKVKAAPKSAKKVLLAVTVTKPAEKTNLKVGGIVIKAPAKKQTTWYVVAKRTHSTVTVINAKKQVNVKIVLIGVPR